MTRVCRNGRAWSSGVTLLSVMLMLVLISSVAAMAQHHAIAVSSVYSRLTLSNKQAVARQSLLDLVRPVIGEAALRHQAGLGSPWSLRGEPFEMLYDGHSFVISAQDVSSLPNLLYMNEEVVINLLPEISSVALAELRNTAANTEIYSVAQALSLLQVDIGLPATIKGSARINQTFIPAQFERTVKVLPRAQRTFLGPGVVRVELEQL